MERRGLAHLSDLVLVEVLAALPLQQLLRLAQMGGQRLQKVSCRPYVLKRATGVNFPTLVKAFQAGRRVREAFCGKAVLKRLYGKVDIYSGQSVEVTHTILQQMQESPVDLHLRLHGNLTDVEFKKIFPINMNGRVRYITELKCSMMHFDRFELFPNLIMVLSSYPTGRGDEISHRNIAYRPALFLECNAVDLVRAVFGYVDINDAELALIEREATKSAGNRRHMQGKILVHAWNSAFDEASVISFTV